jgi:hypothetical protein
LTLQLINVGTSPNDGTGDTIRDGLIKVNENFTDVYTNFQTRAGLSANVAKLTANNSTFAFGKTENALNVNTATYALGSLTNAFSFGTAASFASNGNFGIGTASPGSKLTVSGLVESSSGGYKFPDGSVQTIAAITTPANSIANGFLTYIDWNIFNNKQNALSAANSTAYGYLTAADWVTFNNKQNALSAANSVVSGYLKATDWVIFNNKQNALSAANSTVYGYLSAADWVTFNSKQNALPAASGLANGYLKASDWTAFNNKQNALSAANSSVYGYLTAADWVTFNSKQNALLAANSTANGFLTAADWFTFNSKQNVLPAASGSANGYLTATDWTTFNNKQNVLPAATNSANGYLKATDWVIFNNKQNALGNASGTVSGILTSTDWTTFNNKQNALSAANSTANGFLSAANWVTFNNKQDLLAAANSSVSGYLKATDWVIFNGKQDKLNAANSSANGFLTAADWNTFNNKQNVLSAANSTANGFLRSTDWVTFNNKQNALGNASASVSGILTSTDWNTFNNKQNALLAANASTSGYLTAADWVTFNNKQNTLLAANTNTNGYLTYIDWNTFNNKQNALSAANSTAYGYLSAEDWITFNNKQSTLLAANSTANGFLSFTNWITFNNKQANLVSGTNIKTINGTSLLGSGNITTTQGTVTSIAVSSGSVSGLSLSGGTITSSGTIALTGTLSITGSNFGSQTRNTFFAAPNGTEGNPSFRAILATDIPTLNQNTTGSAGSATNILGGGTRKIVYQSATDTTAFIDSPIDGTYLRYTTADGFIWSSVSGAQGGTVTSVTASASSVSGLSLSGGTITGTGTIALTGTLNVTGSNFSSQTKNFVLAAPSDSSGTPTFRALVAGDIPTLNQDTTGTSNKALYLSGGAALRIPYQSATDTTAFIGAPSDNTFLKYTTASGFSWASINNGGTFTLQNANRVFAGPISGSEASPTFRSLVAADLPTISYNDLSNKPAIYGSITIGTTSVPFNRSSAMQTLSGVNIDGTAGGAVSLLGGSSFKIPYQSGTNTTAFIDAPTSGTYLKYTTADGFTWSSVSVGPGGAAVLTDLTDVLLSTPVSGQILKYDGDHWINSDFTAGAINLSDLTDATISSPTNGQVLKYNGTKWVNGTATVGVTSITVNDTTVSGLSLSGGTITGSGTIALTGTLSVSGANFGAQPQGYIFAAPFNASGNPLFRAMAASDLPPLGGSNFTSQNPNTFLASPNGASGSPTFRSIVAADIPTLNQNTTGSAGSVVSSLSIGSGLSGSSYNGSSAVTISLQTGFSDTVVPYGAKVANRVLAGPTSGTDATPSFRALVAADIPQLAYSSLSGLPTIATSVILGSTSVPFNRSSGALSLSGVSIDGSSGSTVKATNIAGGLIRQIPYQTAADTTAFITAPSDGTYLNYTTSGGFAWNALTLNAVSGISISSPTNGQILKYNGSSWVNGTDATNWGGTQIKTANYTISVTDSITTIEVNSSGSVIITLPQLSSQIRVDIVQIGIGTVTISPSSGCTLRSRVGDGSVTLTAQYSGCTVYNNSGGNLLVWTVVGDVAK